MGKTIRFNTEFGLQSYLETMAVNCETMEHLIKKLKNTDCCVVGSVVYGRQELCYIASQIDIKKLKKRHSKLIDENIKGNIIADVAGHI